MMIFSQNLSSRKLLKGFAVAIVYCLLVYLIWKVIPEQYYVDWTYGFRPATLELLSGRSPYNAPGIYNPPWTFLPLIPLALLPNKLGAILLSLINLLSFFYIARRLGANILIASLFLLTPQLGFKIISNPNIDFLAAFGFLLPPQIGLFFLAIKPQIGVAVAIYWLISAWMNGGFKETVRIFGPIILVFLISVLVFGPFFLEARLLIESDLIWYKYPLWPYTVPIGLTLLVLALRHSQKGLSITASPFLSPYVPTYSYPIALLGLVSNSILFYPAYLGMWITYLISGF